MVNASLQIDLQLVNPINKRWRRSHAAVAMLSLVLWLFMSVTEVCTPLHAWMHGGTIPENDDCALVAIAHGKVETVVCAAPVVVPVTGIEIVPRLEFSTFRPTIACLPDGRGPPVLPVVS
jgi:hypothetical protein